MAKLTRGRASLALGTLAGAAAAAAAGYYFYASKDAKRHRRAAAAWAKRFKDEVLEQARKLENIDRKNMVRIIDKAADAYRSAKGIDRRELERAAKELKAHWRLLALELGGGKRVKKPSRKRAKKGAKSV